jgi:hypothetical protein
LLSAMRNTICVFIPASRCQKKTNTVIQRFLLVYRVLSFLERLISFDLRQVDGLVLTRDSIDQEIEKPIVRLLQEQVDRELIRGYTLFVDKDSAKRTAGILDLFVEVAAIWPPEIYLLKIETPEFKKHKINALS